MLGSFSLTKAAVSYSELEHLFVVQVLPSLFPALIETQAALMPKIKIGIL